MSRLQKILALLFCTISIIAITIMVISICYSHNNIENGEFIPPDFEKSAIDGEPDVPENSGYSLMSLDDDYNIYVCGKLKNNNGETDVYFTSDINNNVWVKLQIISETGEIIGETGIVKPGQYVKTIKLKNAPNKDFEVKLKVVGYEPETYHSGGSAEMKTTIDFKQ